MAIYTGNNGRVYVARQANNSIKKSGGNTITRQLRAAVSNNQIFQVVTVTGAGSNAVVRATASGGVNAQVPFKVVDGGLGYNAGDKVYFAKNQGGVLKRFTADFALSSADIATSGIDNERDLVSGDDFLYGKVSSWQLSSSSEVTDTTALGDVTRSYRPSITSGEGTATIMFYEDDIDPTSGSKDIFGLSEVLFPRGLAPAVIISLAVDGGVDTDELFKTNFVFNAYITGATVSVSYGEVVTVETTFTVDGPLLDIPTKLSASTI